MKRDHFYDEQIKLFKNNKGNTRAAAIIDILLFTPDRQIILQKRSGTKKHNPNLIDKAIGGHIKWGETVEYTVMVETLQELNVPSIVLDSKENFVKTYKLLKDHLHNSAIIQFVESRISSFPKFFGKELIDISKKYYLYFGVYNGSIRPVDKEAEGVIFTDYNSLAKKIITNPESYTEDLKFYLKKYSNKIDDFLKNLK